MFNPLQFFVHTFIAIGYSITAGILLSLTGFKLEDKKKLNGVCLKGKVAIVTGSNTGIGKETAIKLCALGADVVIACRDNSKGIVARDEVADNAKNITSSCGNVTFLRLDLADLKSVYEFVIQFSSLFQRLDILVNNAGLATSSKTVNGLNTTFQVNYLGHYLLTRLLMQTFEAQSEPMRIVNLSSVLHHLGRKNFARSALTFQTLPGPYYNDSKFYMTIFTLELNKRYSLLNTISKQNRVLSVAANPGAVRSNIWRGIPPPISWIWDILAR
jgi:NAD(P)-dependent dehydrogenase (short-subunit alcohol dehydrogenase family)